MEFGLSRITASAVAAMITDSSLTPDQVRNWIKNQSEASFSQMSAIVIAELRAKSLLSSKVEVDSN